MSRFIILAKNLSRKGNRYSFGFEKGRNIYYRWLLVFLNAVDSDNRPILKSVFENIKRKEDFEMENKTKMDSAANVVDRDLVAEKEEQFSERAKEVEALSEESKDYQLAFCQAFLKADSFKIWWKINFRGREIDTSEWRMNVTPMFDNGTQKTVAAFELKSKWPEKSSEFSVFFADSLALNCFLEMVEVFFADRKSQVPQNQVD